ncbi:pyridoxamine 5'-phosphate oxidase family protein [Mycolicibacterium smegmatis]|uniref:pyridoxamine 5'-phosphate oxidase family protein n=1 Tax=Mycolicibacterium smegmatis TaxID=1772 RepID=UPI001E4C55BB|nr:pyridoxamine 5'-phosphate oxidase family protein [Mycolicibacterium smegmatis]UGU34094.1 pyridoxamine 5'-phosphate oxidase family protein [Mycolicibacterium smegmatis]ULN68935.1 pyridoxamine 5'-phosphate oxidase family protein [Mycolicibacterium smegmatis]
MSDQITTTAGDAVTILSATECWYLLKSVALGRIVTTVDNTSHIFPINFVVQNRTVLFRTAEGTKLVSAAINNNVLFEADDHDTEQGWSVIVRGVARTVRDEADLAEAQRAELLPWTATAKTHWVRVLPTQITGRRFCFGPEPTAVDAS